MNINDLIVFYPNTVAKSKDVNDNFLLLANEINSTESSLEGVAYDVEVLQSDKANITGDKTVQFYVDNPTDDYHAVNKKTMDEYLGAVLDYINGLIISKEDDTHILVSPGICFSIPDSVKLSLSSQQSVENTGQQASTTYVVFITGDDTGATIDIVIDISTNNPNQQPSNISTHTQYRRLGYFTTDSSNHISVVTSESNTKEETPSTFTAYNTDISSGTTDLSSIIPADGHTYLVWVFNHIYTEGGDIKTKISTDVFPETQINTSDHDAGRTSKSDTLVCVPVGQARTITINRASKIVGYMRA